LSVVYGLDQGRFADEDHSLQGTGRDKGNAGYENGKPAVYIKPVSTSGGER
jgi:hypothetical protein